MLLRDLSGSPVSRAALGVLLAAAVLLGSPDVLAQPRPEGATATAELLFKEGRQLMTENRLKEACPKLAQSQALDPAAGTLLNLAECYEKLGQVSTAFATYKQAWDAASERKRPDWVSYAEERMRSLEPRLPRVRITGQKPESAHLELDGRPLVGASSGISLRVDPGEHRVVVVDREREIAVRIFQATEGVTTEVSIDAGASAPPKKTPLAPPPPVPSSGGIAPAVWILGASSLVSFAAGGVFLGVREGQVSSIVSQCGEDGAVLAADKYATCSSRGVGAATALSIVGFGLGAVLGASALIVHFTSNRREGDAVSALCAPGIGGAACLVRF